MPRYIDTSKVTIPEGFFEDLNVPKLLEWLNNQPTADVALKSEGEWVKHGYKWRCSNCGRKINIDGTPMENGLYYCSNCGAHMKGGAE